MALVEADTVKLAESQQVSELEIRSAGVDVIAQATADSERIDGRAHSVFMALPKHGCGIFDCGHRVVPKSEYRETISSSADFFGRMSIVLDPIGWSRSQDRSGHPRAELSRASRKHISDSARSVLWGDCSSIPGLAGASATMGIRSLRINVRSR